MAVLLVLGLLLAVAWFVTRDPRGRRATQPPPEPEQLGRLLEALYRDGVVLGYKRAWAHQVESEQGRVRTFVRRRTTTMLLACASGALVAALPLLAAVEVLPNQGAWLPDLPRWAWLLLALGAFGAFAGLGAALLPRDYRRYFSNPAVNAPELARLESEVRDAVAARLSEQLTAARAYVAAVSQERFEAGARQGREEARRGLGQGLSAAEVQARVSSAANAAYVQGRTDGRTEAQTEASRLVSEAYARGTQEGERAALARLEARLRTERQAGYQAGFRAGQAQASAGAARTTRPAGATATHTYARPRTRAEALRILELAEGVSQADIEKRYRELRAAVHPDAIRSKKLPSALVAFAEEQFKLLGEAYDLLRR